MTKNTTPTLTDMQKFNRQIASLTPELKRGFELLFHNPTDAPAVVFDMFCEADRMEELSDLIDTAVLFGLDHAELLSARLTCWMNEPVF